MQNNMGAASLHCVKKRKKENYVRIKPAPSVVKEKGKSSRRN